MNLIFGGAYQGKLEYAKEMYNISKSDVYTCSREASIDFSKLAIYKLEEFVYGCVLEGVEAKDVLMAHQSELSNKTFIACDVSQGLVPMDANDRAFREMMGRTLMYLAKEADSVDRVFCGLGQKIK